jgi:hypothetical protein
MCAQDRSNRPSLVRRPRPAAATTAAKAKDFKEREMFIAIPIRPDSRVFTCGFGVSVRFDAIESGMAAASGFPLHFRQRHPLSPGCGLITAVRGAESGPSQMCGVAEPAPRRQERRNEAARTGSSVVSWGSEAASGLLWLMPCAVPLTLTTRV